LFRQKNDKIVVLLLCLWTHCSQVQSVERVWGLRGEKKGREKASGSGEIWETEGRKGGNIITCN